MKNESQKFSLAFFKALSWLALLFLFFLSVETFAQDSQPQADAQQKPQVQKKVENPEKKVKEEESLSILDRLFRLAQDLLLSRRIGVDESLLRDDV